MRGVLVNFISRFRYRAPRQGVDRDARSREPWSVCPDRRVFITAGATGCEVGFAEGKGALPGRSGHPDHSLLSRNVTVFHSAASAEGENVIWISKMRRQSPVNPDRAIVRVGL